MLHDPLISSLLILAACDDTTEKQKGIYTRIFVPCMKFEVSVCWMKMVKQTLPADGVYISTALHIKTKLHWVWVL